MKKNLRNGVRFLKIFLGDTNHDEAPSNSDSIQKNLDGNDAEKYTLLKRWTKCNTHCYWLLAAIYRSTLQGWRYTLISFPLVWPVARVPRFVLLSYCNCFKVICDLQLNRPIKNTEWSLWVKLILNGHTVLREAAGKRRFEMIKISRTFGIIWNNIMVLIIFKIKKIMQLRSENRTGVTRDQRAHAFRLTCEIWKHIFICWRIYYAYDFRVRDFFSFGGVSVWKFVSFWI